MNILRVIASMDPATGGPCQGIRNSIPELLKHQITNEVVCLDSPSASYLGKDQFPVYALGPGAGPWCYSSKFLPWLINNFERFDAIIIHGLWLYPSYAATQAFNTFIKSKKYKAGSQPRLFIMPHGMLDPYFQKAPGRKLKAFRNWLYWKTIERKVVETADKIMFTTQTELLLARQTFTPYKPKAEVNVGYGIQNPPASTPAGKAALYKQFPRLQDQSYLLFLSRIHEKKGIDLLVDAYIEVVEMNAKQDPEGEVPVLVVAGPGADTAFAQGLIKKINASNIAASKIIFAGMIAGQAKWELFYGCEAFVLPSHQENFGIAVAEALACGKPVLISNQVNIWQEVEANKAGVIGSDTKLGVQEMLQKWLALPSGDKEQMAVQANRCFQENFTIQAAVNKLVHALQLN